MNEAEIQKRVGESYEVPNSVLRAVPAPLVTVRTSTYQHGPYIRECIEGVLNQKTSFPFEYIIGEDFSTDGTREIVFDYSRKFPNLIRVVTANNNVGMLPNALRCLFLARGKYLALCEGDDWWHNPLKLQKQIDIMEADASVSLVCSDVDIFNTNTGKTLRSVDRRLGTWSQDLQDMTTALLLRRVTPHTCTVVIRREQWQQVLQNNPYEFSTAWPLLDLQLFIELSRLGRFVHLDEALATYRVLPHSASRSTSPQKQIFFLHKVHELSEHYVNKLCLDDTVRATIRAKYFSVLASLARNHKDEATIRAAKQFLKDFPFSTATFQQRWLVWSLGSSMNLTLTRLAFPWYSRLLKLPGRLTRLLARAASRWLFVP